MVTDSVQHSEIPSPRRPVDRLAVVEFHHRSQGGMQLRKSVARVDGVSFRNVKRRSVLSAVVVVTAGNYCIQPVVATSLEDKEQALAVTLPESILGF